ncbi:hypothetical protein [Kingella potus]|nr:hypothetical protein [Kingella potus]UOP00836.1 hypothetical protein LVJ84_14035 [Kingella potus]
MNKPDFGRNGTCRAQAEHLCLLCRLLPADSSADKVCRLAKHGRLFQTASNAARIRLRYNSRFKS